MTDLCATSAILLNAFIVVVLAGIEQMVIILKEERKKLRQSYGVWSEKVANRKSIHRAAFFTTCACCENIPPFKVLTLVMERCELIGNA